MIARTLKLYPTQAQDALLREWWQIGTGVWNWAVGQYVNDPRIPGRWTTYASLCRATRGHALRIGFNAMALQGILKDVAQSWSAYRRGIRGRPHRKGRRNRLASLPFRQTSSGTLRRTGRGVRLPILGDVRARGWRGLPDATIKTLRIHRLPRGWYATIVLDAEPKAIPITGNGHVGVDLGFATLAVLSDGSAIPHPREQERIQRRIAQANRALNYRLLGRLQQSLKLARRTRNHEISRDLVSRFALICVSKDNLRGFQRRHFGKSVQGSAHGGLRTMLATKCRQAGRVYVEVPSRNSTRTCSACGALTGPTGLPGLRVRQWACACGAHHDRDVNAAVNTLRAGAVLALESGCDPTSEISSAVHSVA